MTKTKQSLLGKVGDVVSDQVIENTKKTIKINHDGLKSESISEEREGKFILKKASMQFYLNEFAKFEADYKVYLSQEKKANATLKRAYNKNWRQYEILKTKVEQNRSESEITKMQEAIFNQLNEDKKQYYLMIKKAEKSYLNSFRELLKVSSQFIEESLPQEVDSDNKELIEKLLFRFSNLFLKYRDVSSENEYQTLINSIKPEIYELIKLHSGENKYVII